MRKMKEKRKTRGTDTVTLFGRNSIVERLKANPKSIKRIMTSASFDDQETLSLIRSRGIPVREVAEKDLLRMKDRERVQGLVAEVEPFEYASFEELVKRPDGEKLTFVLLDGVTDPQNLGAIIRITACFGDFGIVIPERDACEVNETVLNIAAGGENYVPVCRMNNLSNALIHAKKAGYWTAGAAVEGGEDLNGVSFPFPLCIVLGSEGKGIHYGVGKHIELKVTLPMRGAVLSFNVAMASAIFCYEITRQRAAAGKT